MNLSVDNILSIDSKVTTQSLNVMKGPDTLFLTFMILTSVDDPNNRKI